LEADQVFKVTVSLEGLGGIDEVFYARMQRGGRIVVPRLHADFLKRDELGLEGHVLEVTIEPA